MNHQNTEDQLQKDLEKLLNSVDCLTEKDAKRQLKNYIKLCFDQHLTIIRLDNNNKIR